MADCRKCKHNYKMPGDEPRCNLMCDGESDFEPITNAMRIRSMSDAELAEFLSKTVWEEGENLFDCVDCECVFPCTECRMYLDWLQSEAE